MARDKTGSDALARRLQAIPRELLVELRPALIKGAREIADNMRALAEASRDSGDLIDSIEVTGPGETTPAFVSGGGSKIAGENQALITVGNEDMRHGHLVEFGTAHSEAQPFMIPGFRLGKRKAQNRINRAINKAIKEAGKPNAGT